jgi:hypothetical protein
MNTIHTPPRQLTDHKLNGLNEAIDIIVSDGPGAGGANHLYDLVLGAAGTGAPIKTLTIEFQNGPIQEVGHNGWTNEALLAVLIDRMRGFQGMNYDTPAPPPPADRRAPYACRENAIALTHLEDAMHWLQHRTRARLARGVEGTLKV